MTYQTELEQQVTFQEETMSQQPEQQRQSYESVQKSGSQVMNQNLDCLAAAISKANNDFLRETRPAHATVTSTAIVSQEIGLPLNVKSIHGTDLQDGKSPPKKSCRKLDNEGSSRIPVWTGQGRYGKQMESYKPEDREVSASQAPEIVDLTLDEDEENGFKQEPISPEKLQVKSVNKLTPRSDSSKRKRKPLQVLQLKDGQTTLDNMDIEEVHTCAVHALDLLHNLVHKLDSRYK